MNLLATEEKIRLKAFKYFSKNPSEDAILQFIKETVSRIKDPKLVEYFNDCCMEARFGKKPEQNMQNKLVKKIPSSTIQTKIGKIQVKNKEKILNRFSPREKKGITRSTQNLTPTYVQNKILIRPKSLIIKSLTNELKWDVSYLLKLLCQKGIHREVTESISEYEYGKIAKTIHYRIVEIKRITAEFERSCNQEPVTKQNRGGRNFKRDSVYNKIARFGIGKVIYIRSR
jgi:hypothetical protein